MVVLPLCSFGHSSLGHPPSFTRTVKRTAYHGWFPHTNSMWLHESLRHHHLILTCWAYLTHIQIHLIPRSTASTKTLQQKFEGWDRMLPCTQYIRPISNLSHLEIVTQKSTNSVPIDWNCSGLCELLALIHLAFADVRQLQSPLLRYLHQLLRGCQTSFGIGGNYLVKDLRRFRERYSDPQVSYYYSRILLAEHSRLPSILECLEEWRAQISNLLWMIWFPARGGNSTMCLQIFWWRVTV